MAVHVISNPVPTPEEMGRFLGLSSERVAAVRDIMSAPSPQRGSKRSSGRSRVQATKAARTGTRSASKRGR